MNSYKHSGAFGDLIYSLAVARHLGPGLFYLHLNQINWIGQHYYGSPPNPVHQGRLTKDDFEFMREFMLAQDYITDFKILDSSAEITHNLDRFRVPFVNHPGNYVDIYASVFGVKEPKATEIRTNPWITVPKTTEVAGRDIVINRTARWLPATLSPKWKEWQQAGWEQRSIFVGTKTEHHAFCSELGWDIPWQSTQSMLELAEVIAGAQTFIGNQSMALSLAIGLGKNYWCEARTDLPLLRNECYFPNQPGGNYF